MFSSGEVFVEIILKKKTLEQLCLSLYSNSAKRKTSTNTDWPICVPYLPSGGHFRSTLADPGHY